MTGRQRFGLLLAFGSAAVLPSPAAATFIGQTFTADYYYPDRIAPYPSGSFSPRTFVVGSGVETVGNIEDVTFLSTDFGASSLRIDFDTRPEGYTFGNGIFNGPIFTASADLGVTGFTVNGATNLAGFTAANVLVSGNRIELDFRNLAYDPATVVALDFTFRQGASPIPEPATWLTLVAGCGLVGVALRRTRRAPIAA